MAYPPISTLPPAPSRQDPANFANEADAFLGALPTFQSEVNAAGTYIDGIGAAVDADAATASAAASAAIAASGATAWVSGGSYTAGQVVWSPITYQTYRAKTTHSGITTDPSADTTRWSQISLSSLSSYVGNVGITGNLDVTGTTDFNGDVTFSNAIIETVYSLSGTTPALNPSNGTVQTWTLSANSSPTDSLVSGEAMTLMIDDGSAYTITWPSVTWKTDGGNAPTLNTTGFTAVILWKVSTTLYGARVGDA